MEKDAGSKVNKVDKEKKMKDRLRYIWGLIHKVPYITLSFGKKKIHFPIKSIDKDKKFLYYGINQKIKEN